MAVAMLTPDLPDPEDKKHEFGKMFMPVDDVEAWWIKKSRENFAYFYYYYTDLVNTMPDHHIEWAYHLLDRQRENRFINIIAFRGAAKTHITVHVIAYLIGKYPMLTNAVFSSNAELAEARLGEIKEIITSDRYQNVFPHIHIDTKKKNNAKQFTVWSSQWKGNEIGYDTWRSLVGRFGQPRDATLFSAGITASGIAGRRFTGLVMLDDIHDEKNSGTPQQRAKIISIVKKTIMGCMWKHSNPKMVSISTRWAEDDFPGTVELEKRRDGTPIWKTISVPVMDADGEPTWKGFWTKQKIEDNIEEYGELVFQLMFMNNPKAATLGEFTMDMFRQPLPELLPEFDEVCISCDFSGTESAKSDYNVFYAIAKDKNKPYKMYVLDMRRFKRENIEKKTDELIEFADEIFENYQKLDKIYVEENDSRAEKQSILAKRPDMPVETVKTKGDKADRAKPLATVAQGARLFLNQAMKGKDAAISEIVGFPSTHDDCLDAMDLVFQHPRWQLHRKVKAGSKKIQSPFMM